MPSFAVLPGMKVFYFGGWPRPPPRNRNQRQRRMELAKPPPTFPPRAGLSSINPSSRRPFPPSEAREKRRKKLKDQPMLKVRLSGLALSSLLLASSLYAQFADSVVSYTAGAGVSPGFTDPTRAVGSPTTFIGYQNADPFNPPYLATNPVSVVAGGSLTLQFNTPILNSPAHPFGL